MSDSDLLILRKKNDQVIEITAMFGLADTPTPINDATITVTVIDPMGANVLHATGIVAAFVADGVYRASLDQTFDPPVGPGYRAHIVTTTPRGEDGDEYREVYVAEG